jgi:hypothetical protein
MLAPVNSRAEPKFGPRQTIWAVILVLGAVVLMRLLLAH